MAINQRVKDHQMTTMLVAQTGWTGQLPAGNEPVGSTGTLEQMQQLLANNESQTGVKPGGGWPH